MKASKTILKKANIVPRLQLAIQLKDEQGNKKGVKGTGPHRVKLISDKIVKGTEYQTGTERYEIEYLLEENGEKKKYRVPMKDKNGEIHYLIQRFAEIPEGTEVILEYQRKGLKGYIDIQVVGEQEIKDIEEDIDEDIPIINPEENEKQPKNFEESEFDPGI